MIELSDKSSLLNSTTIYTKCDHTFYSVLITKKNGPIDITFALSPFYFSLSYFLSPGAWSSSHVHTTTIDFISYGHLHPWVPPRSFTWVGPSYLVIDLDARISPNIFHQLAKTKLGLSKPQWSASRIMELSTSMTMMNNPRSMVGPTILELL